MVDGYEPHSHIASAVLTVRDPYDAGTCSVGWGEVYPGWWGMVGGWVGYTGYLARPSQDPIFSIY